MITRSSLILLFLFANILFINGQAIKTTVSVKEFTENPWPFEPNLSGFYQNFGKLLKIEKYTVKNRFSPTQKDTIIRFFKGKTEIFFYKPFNGNPLFIAANVYDNRIKLRGDVVTGMSSKDFFNIILYPETDRDTIRISLPQGIYNTSVIMKQNKVNHIKIEARNKNR